MDVIRQGWNHFVVAHTRQCHTFSDEGWTPGLFVTYRSKEFSSLVMQKVNCLGQAKVIEGGDEAIVNCNNIIDDQ